MDFDVWTLPQIKSLGATIVPFCYDCLNPKFKMFLSQQSYIFSHTYFKLLFRTGKRVVYSHLRSKCIIRQIMFNSLQRETKRNVVASNFLLLISDIYECMYVFVDMDEHVLMSKYIFLSLLFISSFLSNQNIHNCNSTPINLSTITSLFRF